MLLRRFLRGPVQLQAALWLLRRGRDGYRALSAQDRSHATRLVKKSKGRPGNLTKGERSELRALIKRAARGRQDEER